MKSNDDICTQFCCTTFDKEDYFSIPFLNDRIGDKCFCGDT